MDSGLDMTQDSNNNDQLVDAVPVEAKEVVLAQDQVTDSLEMHVEGEVDQQEPTKDGMTEAQLRAAWKEERSKRKSKAESESRLENELKQLKEQYASLSETVGKVTKGAKPTLESCSYDEDEYEQKLKSYYGVGAAETKTPAKTNTQADSFELNEDQEFHAHKHESEIKRHIPEFDKAKAEVIGLLGEALGGNGQSALNAIYANAHSFGIDPAKAVLALSKNKGDIAALAKTKTAHEVSVILRKLESKVQLRQKSKIDTKPEPEINSVGSVNVVAKEVESARKAWQQDSSTANFKALQQAKAKLKKVG
jgi:hypothetical protein